MFVVASSGRCATSALCTGLDRFSDHSVAHEPEPRLLAEAHAKHCGRDYRTPLLERRLAFFAERAGSRYGESFRAATLLPELAAAAPGTRFLVLVRPPLEYVVSAHAMGALRRGDEWDELRIMPRDLPDALSLAEKLALHWDAVNGYLLDFAELGTAPVKVAVVERLELQIEEWAGFLGARIEDRAGLEQHLGSRPNASIGRELPDGYDPAVLRRLCARTWERAQALAAGSGRGG